MKNNTEDIALKKAVFDYFNKSFAEFEEKSNEIVFSDIFENKMDKLIRTHNKITFRLTYTKARKAICIIAIIISIMCCSLSVGAVRDALKNFFITQFSDNAQVNYKLETEDNKNYPKTIEKVYELGYIPEGFLLEDFTKIDISVDTIYLDKTKTNAICLSQYVKDEFDIHMDNRHSMISKTVINNQEYIINASSVSEQYTYIWDNGEYVFCLDGDLPKKEMIKICESVRVKENKNF